MTSESKKLRIYTDGGARGNPGPAGIGAVIQGERAGKFYVVETISRYIGRATNNQAEYKALIAALTATREIGADEIECFLDSELMVKQLNHEYRVKNKELAELFAQVWNLASVFKRITYKHIRRDKNKEADKLVNEAIDKAAGKGYNKLS